ncbi:hypothetical protein CQ040_14760 [Microbacterium sp. MYb54]|nr:hypothetical protein CQ032_19185 [Microbacterium sp. MYb43]PQZ72855.1 hypothetical protein CQ031_18030 [Microbacterium sp. MYb40]PRB19671.1 hypothetical protein CQ040_14760 [Microbacterium sp. MYb54]PRB23359.1 hypothetical protein CQ037_17845 [Microbacterium sp. MYb50]PRB61591.1 hypothetical protein CQ021_18025 [Microbacterium sp. MYb24]PRB70563.1 hypothetical protein CQ027_16530 [Microbacterium sp. MYb32]
MSLPDVEIFYAELNDAASALTNATYEVLTEAANLQGEETGVENPAQRSGLRLEMHRRLTALHDSAYDRVESGDSLAAAISAIASKYSELDVELTGGDRP